MCLRERYLWNYFSWNDFYKAIQGGGDGRSMSLQNRNSHHFPSPLAQPYGIASNSVVFSALIALLWLACFWRVSLSIFSLHLLLSSTPLSLCALLLAASNVCRSGERCAVWGQLHSRRNYQWIFAGEGIREASFVSIWHLLRQLCASLAHLATCFHDAVLLWGANHTSTMKISKERNTFKRGTSLLDVVWTAGLWNIHKTPS